LGNRLAIFGNSTLHGPWNAWHSPFAGWWLESSHPSDLSLATTITLTSPGQHLCNIIMEIQISLLPRCNAAWSFLLVGNSLHPQTARNLHYCLRIEHSVTVDWPWVIGTTRECQDIAVSWNTSANLAGRIIADLWGSARRSSLFIGKRCPGVKDLKGKQTWTWYELVGVHMISEDLLTDRLTSHNSDHIFAALTWDSGDRCGPNRQYLLDEIRVCRSTKVAW